MVIRRPLLALPGAPEQPAATLQCSAVLGANRRLMMQTQSSFFCCCCTKQSTAIFRLHEAGARFDLLFCLLSLCLLIFERLLK